MTAAAKTKTKTILVIEDDEMQRTLVGYMIAEMGHKSVMAQNAFEAKQWLAANQPDLILLDIMLPQINGIELALQMRSHLHVKAPVIIMTVLDDEETIRDAVEIGSVDFIQKPFGIAELEKKIKRVLDH